MPPAITVKERNGPEPNTWTVELGRDATLGKSLDCNIAVRGHPRVSPHHLTLTFDGATLWIENGRPAGGTWLAELPEDDEEPAWQRILSRARQGVTRDSLLKCASAVLELRFPSHTPMNDSDDGGWGEWR